MARFYADIQGNRGGATRMGTEKTGLQGHIRGWGIGASVHMSVNDQGEDVVSIRLTSGSNSMKQGKCLGSFTSNDLD